MNTVNNSLLQTQTSQSVSQLSSDILSPNVSSLYEGSRSGLTLESTPLVSSHDNSLSVFSQERTLDLSTETVVNPVNQLYLSEIEGGYTGQENPFTVTSIPTFSVILLPSLICQDNQTPIQGTNAGEEKNGTFLNDNISGLGGNDVLRGNGCHDKVNGGDGNDYIEGNEGNDTLIGGDGLDKLIGGAGEDELRGNEKRDHLFGGEGNDLLVGGGGNDDIEGNEENDTLIGGDGLDKLIGGAGEDELRGNEKRDHLFGGEGNDLLVGGNGDDLLQGDGGDDILFGDEGDDYLEGGQGVDFLRGGKNRDTLSGDAGNDFLFGQDNNDLLRGGKGDDQLNGGDGQDTLTGFGGGSEEVDNLTGGAHKDVFDLSNPNGVFNAYTLAGDLDYAEITDFQKGLDTIQVNRPLLPGSPLGATSYSLSVTGNDTSIYFHRTPNSSELIGVVLGVNNLVLGQDVSFV